MLGLNKRNIGMGSKVGVKSLNKFWLKINLRKFFFKSMFIVLMIYLGLTLLFNQGRLYQRNSYSPISIKDSKENGTFIDSFYFEHLKDFEIWRCYLKFVDYYGFGGLYAHRYISKDSCFYIALRYKGNKHKNLRFNTSNSDNFGWGFSKRGNGDLWADRIKKHDSTIIWIFNQPSNINSTYLVDSVNLKW